MHALVMTGVLVPAQRCANAAASPAVPCYHHLIGSGVHSALLAFDCLRLTACHMQWICMHEQPVPHAHHKHDCCGQV